MPVKSGLMQRINQSTAYQSETGNPIYRSSCTYGYWGTESSGAANFRGSISIDNHHPGSITRPEKSLQATLKQVGGTERGRGEAELLNRRSARGMLLRPKFQKRQKRQVVFQVGILVAVATGAQVEMLGIFFSSRNYSDWNLINSKV